MTPAESAAFWAAREKRSRKLESRYTSTPAALARRAQMEADFTNGTPVAPPDSLYLLTEAEELEPATMSLQEAAIHCGLDRVGANGRIYPVWNGLPKRLVERKSS